ncbi:hypothetical protein HEB94_003181 [Actinopolymorpha pittospori]|uniref:Uncharacterized protein n=1 Tax=Actinopolymorpha pittospori TaxID=648752 RepID=A0A927RK41_9ACTN|nr:hypothetical protein [Actinopolymorpha pittospori]
MLAGLLEAEADACKHMADPREAEADERERPPRRVVVSVVVSVPARSGLFSTDPNTATHA